MHPELIHLATSLAIVSQPWVPALETVLALLPAGLDFLLAAAYFSIAFTLLHYYSKRPLPGEHGKLAVFVGFGLVCGTVHALGVLGWWGVLPGAQGAVKPLAAALAALVAVLLWRLVPRLLALPSPRDLQRANAQLREEVVARGRAEADLRTLQANLEAVVQQRTVELERVRDDLRREVAERRRVDREKDELLRTVSHELRTPLSSIGGALHALSGELALADAERSELADIALRSTGRLVRLVNGLLEIDGMQSGRLRLSLKPLRVGALVRDAVQELQPFARKRGVRLVLAGADLTAVSRGDADRLMQVLTNLISNAVRHGPPGSSVSVRTEVTDEVARVAVTDQGPGVPADYRERVFDRFVQVPHGSAVPADGIGLGLSIGRAIVEGHGGRIGVESQPGEHTTFYFELPLLSEGEGDGESEAEGEAAASTPAPAGPGATGG